MLLLRLLLLLTFAALPLTGARAQAPVDTPAVAEAVLEQQSLPQLQARRAAAQARADAAGRYFAGRVPLGAAFPELDGAPLGSDAYLAGRLQALDRAGQARAAERMQPPPDGLRGRALGRWQAGRAAALDAEDAAAALERRLLLALRAGLVQAPLLRLEALANERARWTALQATVPPEAGPARTEALAQAERAGQAEAALKQLVVAARRAMTVPGDAALAERVDAELDQGMDWQDGALQTASRVDRLSRVKPLLAPDQAARVQALLDQAELARLQAELPLLQAQAQDIRQILDSSELGEVLSVDDAQVALDDAQAALAELPPAPAQPPGPDASPLDQLEAQWQQALRTLAERRVALAEARVEQARIQAEEAANQALTEAEVDEARRRADVSEQRAAAADSEAEGQVRGELAELQRHIADELEAERVRHKTRAEALQAHKDALETARTEADEAVALPTLAAGRTQRIDAALARHRTLVTELRDAVSSTREELGRLRGKGKALLHQLPDTSELPSSIRADIDAEVAVVVADIERLRAMQEADALKELDWATQLLTVAKSERRQLRPQASRGAQQRSMGEFTGELRLEALEAPIIVETELRNTLQAIRQVPERVTDVTAIWAFLTRSFELVFLAILWILLRRNAETWSRRVLDALWRQQQGENSRLDARALVQAGWIVDGDIRALSQPLAPLLFSAVDISVAWMLFHMTRDGLATLALVILLWLGRSVVKAAPLVVPFFFASPDARRPALRVTSQETIERLQRSVQVVAFAGMAVVILRFVALDLFEADRFNDLVSLARLVFYVGVAVWLLDQWADDIRMAVLGAGEDDQVVARLTAQSPNVVMKLLRAAGGLVYVLWRSAAELLVRVAEGRPGLGWLASALARARLRSAPADEEAVTAGLVAKDELDRADLPIPRPAAIEAVGSAMQGWQDERRRGMVAVVGARGAGKSVVMAAIDDLAAEHLPGVPVSVLQLDTRTFDPTVALRWLSRVTGVGPGHNSDEEELIRVLSAQEPRVFVVPAMHRLALRAVGGFGAVQAVMRVMQATSEEHFWVCGFHSATWSYLAGVASSMNLEAFRARIQLEGLPAADLGAWVKERAQQGGYSLSFHRLLGRSPGGLDATRAAERAEQAYWRLLADASMGIPEVAWGFVRGSLCRSRIPMTLDVQLFQAPSAKDLESLPDLDLFVLTAIVIHDELDTASIGEVLNAPVGQVLESCRHLDGLNVLDHADERAAWHIMPAWRPAVERVLRQKHFLYMR